MDTSLEKASEWDEISRELDAALAADRPPREKTVAIRSKDQVWRNACKAAAAVAGDYDWSAPIVRKARDELTAFVCTSVVLPSRHRPP